MSTLPSEMGANRADTASLIAKVDSIDGRDEDYLVMNDGCEIGWLDNLLKDIVEINEAQFFQEKIGSEILRIFISKNFKENSFEN